MAKVMIFKAFERFWHWSQAALIISMLITGFNIHQSHHLFDFETAVNLHIAVAWTLIGLWALALFWHITTGEWKHYIPTKENLMEVVRYYGIGIFGGEAHPYHKTRWAKHNPLQRLAYLFFTLMISPAIWISGLAYLYYQYWDDWGLNNLSLETVALIHTGAAFAMLVFFIIHVYLAFMGKNKVFAPSHIKVMITGYDEIEEETW